MVSFICRLFSSDFLVKFIPHQFNGIYVHWLHQPRHQLKDVLFLFAFNVPLAEFTNMLWVIILHEYKSLIQKPHSRWDCMMLQLAVIASLIQFALCLLQIPDFAIGKSSPLHVLQLVWYRGLQLLHQLFAAHRFISPKDFISLLYCPATGDFWHCFASPTVISWQQFCHIGQLHRVFSSQYMLTHIFHNMYSDVWSCQPFVIQAR